jgi:hypothetical protein
LSTASTAVEPPAAATGPRTGGVDWGNVPIVNFFYDIVNDAPSHDEMRELINVIALLGALMLGMACGITGSVSWGDIEEMAEIVQECYYPGETKRAVSLRLAEYSIIGTALLFASLIGVVVVYTSLCTVGFGKIPKRDVQRAMDIWWASGGNFMTGLNVALLVGGVVCSCMAYFYLCVITFWDPRGENGDCNETNTLHGMAKYTYFFSIWGTLFTSVCFMSHASSQIRPFMESKRLAPGRVPDDE